MAQCVDNFSIGNDTTVCAGTSLLLNAGPGYVDYLWNNGHTGQTRTVTGAGTYSCRVTEFNMQGDLVVNGNFSAGATGFTTDLVPGTGGSWGLLSNPGQYAVTTNSSLVHNNFASCTDHTGSGGRMMVVNGSDAPGLNVWCQTITVQPGVDYAFSAWLMTVVLPNPAVLEFTINGQPIGDPLTASYVTCQWQGFHAIWNAGATTTATICISNQNVLEDGNDFALDDISFAPMCIWNDTIVVTEQAYPTPDLGTDVSICADQAVTLAANWPAADAFVWSTGATTPTLTAATSGTYWVDVTEGGCTGRDSVDVVLRTMPTVDLGPQQDLCTGETVLLDATVPGATYTWQNGSQTPTFLATQTGTYSVTVDLNGCTTQDAVQVNVSPLPVLDLGADTTICDGTSLTLDVTRPGGTYRWNDGTTSGARTLTDAGLYGVTVTEQGCSSSDSLTLVVIPLPTVDLGPDFLLCEGTWRVLELDNIGFDTRWSDGSNGSQLAVSTPGLFSVTLWNRCDTVSDSLVVTMDRCDCPVHVPNAFTPDNDGLNDLFIPLFSCEAKTYQLRIFDRWGRELWQTNDPNQPWDGSSSAGPVPSGLYNWLLRVRTNTVHDGGSREFRGHLTLLR